MIETVRQEALLDKSHHQSLLFGLKCYTGRKAQPGNHFNYAKGDYNILWDSVQCLNISDKIKDMGVTDAWNTAL